MLNPMLQKRQDEIKTYIAAAEGYYRRAHDLHTKAKEKPTQDLRSLDMALAKAECVKAEKLLNAALHLMNVEPKANPAAFAKVMTLETEVKRTRRNL